HRVELRPAAVLATLGEQAMLIRLEMRGQGLAAAWCGAALRPRGLLRKLRRLGPLVERGLRCPLESGRRRRRLCGGGLTLLALRDGEQLSDTLVQLRDLLDQARHLRAQRGVLSLKGFGIEHGRQQITPPERCRSPIARTVTPRGGTSPLEPL